MRRFVQLFREIDTTTKTNEKISAMVRYFDEVSDEDKLHTIALFTGRNPKRIVKTNLLKLWAAELAQIPFWLFEEAYHVVGDLSETISNVLPEGDANHQYGLSYWIEQLQEKLHTSEDEKKAFITSTWLQMNREERFVFNKLSSGAFRMGVSTKLMVKALAKHTKLDENLLMHRIMGNWTTANTTFHELITNHHVQDDDSKPYPFYLAYALEEENAIRNNLADWQIEYKWDGIRCQLIHRSGTLFLWSRGEELITSNFPELQALLNHLPEGVVIDGELIGYKNESILSFQHLQTRISRKKVTNKTMQDVPVCIIAYDLLEINGKDIRHLPLIERRKMLEEMVAETSSDYVQLSPLIEVNDWNKVQHFRADARMKNAEGLMIKHKLSAYETGRKKGFWWKWKLDPYTVDAVMIYAMRGHGRRANLYTDYTFAVWNESGELVPFTKAYSGLTDKEIVEIDAWIKTNTIDKFGPVRSVHPVQVFEIAFEGINYSTRHKSGVALRFPRILRWRKDKPAQEADTLGNLKQLIVATQA